MGTPIVLVKMSANRQSEKTIAYSQWETELLLSPKQHAWHVEDPRSNLRSLAKGSPVETNVENLSLGHEEMLLV